jgi:hypothetical protein
VQTDTHGNFETTENLNKSDDGTNLQTRLSFFTSFQLQIKFMLLLLGLRSRRRAVEIIQGAAKILSKLREQKMLSCGKN